MKGNALPLDSKECQYLPPGRDEKQEHGIYRVALTQKNLDVSIWNLLSTILGAEASE